jgi:hypothetical protein
MRQSEVVKYLIEQKEINMTDYLLQKMIIQTACRLKPIVNLKRKD